MEMEKKRILVVDDEESIQFSYQRLFRRENVEVDVCGNLKDTLAMLDQTGYDVVIADLRLSDPDGREGLEILERVRRSRPDTSVILMTGYGNGDVHEKATELGVLKYFVKPVEVEDLMNLLSRIGIPLESA
ncbi:response regulator [Geomonas sp. Red32]|uniref:response regulator n=1 Tax=Geomonas sp. Red32 TaxID=2912856 RepID=UPI00202CC48F|nr:response regulator [Geomonas sp. Red32]MCM0081441.1 response regulator [Geomonas sp. Red32]